MTDWFRRIAIWIVGIIVIIMVIQEVRNPTPDEHLGTITDIESISAGGFGSTTRCIIFVDEIKRSESGTWCNYQIGDEMCYKQIGVLSALGTCRD